MAMMAVGCEPDEVTGEVAHAYVVLVPGGSVEPDALIAHCRTQLAAYEVPRAVHLVGDPPTTSSGKLVRRMLRASSVPATS
jgi:long-chain acyl-CoA synthetase